MGEGPCMAAMHMRWWLRFPLHALQQLLFFFLHIPLHKFYSLICIQPHPQDIKIYVEDMEMMWTSAAGKIRGSVRAPKASWTHIISLITTHPHEIERIRIQVLLWCLPPISPRKCCIKKTPYGLAEKGGRAKGTRLNYPSTQRDGDDDVRKGKEWMNCITTHSRREDGGLRNPMAHKDTFFLPFPSSFFSPFSFPSQVP